MMARVGSQFNGDAWSMLGRPYSTIKRDRACAMDTLWYTPP